MRLTQVLLNRFIGPTVSRHIKRGGVNVRKVFRTAFSPRFLLPTNLTICMSLSCLGDTLQQTTNRWMKRRLAAHSPGPESVEDDLPPSNDGTDSVNDGQNNDSKPFSENKSVADCNSVVAVDSNGSGQSELINRTSQSKLNRSATVDNSGTTTTVAKCSDSINDSELNDPSPGGITSSSASEPISVCGTPVEPAHNADVSTCSTSPLVRRKSEKEHEKGNELGPYDYVRTRNVVLASIPMGTICHYWYILLDRRIVGSGLKIAFKKLILDQLILSPAMWTAYLGFLSALDYMGQGKGVKDRVLASAADLYIAEWIVWPPAQLINFYFLPTKYRMLYDNLVSLFFDWYSSYVILTSNMRGKFVFSTF